MDTEFSFVMRVEGPMEILKNIENALKKRFERDTHEISYEERGVLKFEYNTSKVVCNCDDMTTFIRNIDTDEMVDVKYECFVCGRNITYWVNDW